MLSKIALAACVAVGFAQVAHAQTTPPLTIEVLAPTDVSVHDDAGASEDFDLVVGYDFAQTTHDHVLIAVQVPRNAYVVAATQPGGWGFAPGYTAYCAADPGETGPAHLQARTCRFYAETFVADNQTAHGSFALRLRLARWQWVDRTSITWTAVFQEGGGGALPDGTVITGPSGFATDTSLVHATAAMSVHEFDADPNQLPERNPQWTVNPVTGESGLAFNIDIRYRNDGSAPPRVDVGPDLALAFGTQLTYVGLVASGDWAFVGPAPTAWTASPSFALDYAGSVTGRQFTNGTSEDSFTDQLRIRVFVSCAQLADGVAETAGWDAEELQGTFTGRELVAGQPDRIHTLGPSYGGPAHLDVNRRVYNTATPPVLVDVPVVCGSGVGAYSKLPNPGRTTAPEGTLWYQVSMQAPGGATVVEDALVADELPAGLDAWRVVRSDRLWSPASGADNSEAQWDVFFCDGVTDALADITMADFESYLLGVGGHCAAGVTQTVGGTVYLVPPATMLEPTHIMFVGHDGLGERNWGSPTSGARFFFETYYADVPIDYLETGGPPDAVNEARLTGARPPVTVETPGAPVDSGVLVALWHIVGGSIPAVYSEELYHAPPFTTVPRIMAPDAADPCVWAAFGTIGDASGAKPLNPSVTISLAPAWQSKVAIVGVNTPGGALTGHRALFSADARCAPQPTTWSFTVAADGNSATLTTGSTASPYREFPIQWTSCMVPAVRVCPRAGGLPLVDGDDIQVDAHIDAANERTPYNNTIDDASITFAVTRAGEELVSVTEQCVPGGVSFDVALENSGGRDLRTVESNFLVPAGATVTAIDAPSHGGLAPTVVCSTDGTTFGTAACATPAAIAAVRVALADPPGGSSLPVGGAPYSYHVVVAPPATSGLELVGAATMTSSIGTTNPASATFTTGTCLGTLMLVKYSDLDGDGLEDAGEPRLAGWEFHIRRAGSPVDVAVGTSDANGEVHLDLTEGAYTVVEFLPTPVQGTSFATPKSNTDNTLASVFENNARGVAVVGAVSTLVRFGNACVCGPRPCQTSACALIGTTASCNYTPNDALACDDGNRCTQNACVGGACAVTGTTTCTATETCSVAACNPDTGQCDETFVPTPDCAGYPGQQVVWGVVASTNGTLRSVRCVVRTAAPAGIECDRDDDGFLVLGDPMCGGTP